MKISVLIDGENYLYEEFLNAGTSIDYQLVFNTEHLTRAEFWNNYFDCVESDYVLFLNPEIIFSKNALEIMLQTLEEDESIGAVGPYVNHSYFGKQEGFLKYDSVESLQFTAKIFESQKSKNARLENFLEGECLLARKLVLDRIKSFDGELVNSRLTQKIFESLSLSFKIWLNGFKIKIVPTHVHLDSPIIVDEDEKIIDNEILNEELGFDWKYSTFHRPELVALIENRKRSLEILDVGCSAGGILLEIQNQIPNANLFGIDIDFCAMKFAALFGNTAVVDIEKFAPSDWHEKFDYIICSDVLEHLQDPLAAMKNMRELLKPTGYLIANMPNVLYIQTLHENLHGNFESDEKAVLDHTRIQFFRMDTIQKMLFSIGLSGELFPLKIFTDDKYEKLSRILSTRFGIPNYYHTTFQWCIRVKKSY